MRKEVETLQKMHHDFADKQKEWDGRIEVAYLSVTALKTFKIRQSKMAIISPGEPFHVKEAGSDWLMNWYTVREKGIALFGPSPMTLIDPISKEEFMDAVQEYAKYKSDWIHHMPSSLSERTEQQSYQPLHESECSSWHRQVRRKNRRLLAEEGQRCWLQ